MLILQFMFILFLIEASNVTIAFDTVYSEIGSKQDELSQTAKLRLYKWVRVQLSSLSKLTLTAIGLSLGLLVLGGVASISVNQLGVSAVLVIASVVAIFYLLTNRREPETSPRR